MLLTLQTCIIIIRIIRIFIKHNASIIALFLFYNNTCFHHITYTNGWTYSFDIKSECIFQLTTDRCSQCSCGLWANWPPLVHIILNHLRNSARVRSNFLLLSPASRPRPITPVRIRQCIESRPCVLRWQRVQGLLCYTCYAT